jgi:hypothetical protein
VGASAAAPVKIVLRSICDLLIALFSSCRRNLKIRHFLTNFIRDCLNRR